MAASLVLLQCLQKAAWNFTTYERFLFVYIWMSGFAGLIFKYNEILFLKSWKVLYILRFPLIHH